MDGPGVRRLSGPFSVTIACPNFFSSPEPIEVLFRVYPGFPTLFWGLSVFFVGDLMGKALWKLVENAARFPRRGERVLCVHDAVSFHRARPCGPRWLPGRGGHASCRAGPPRPRTAVDR